ncbi:MAG: ATP-binding cassette domain-containing protein [Bosea sp. (in: a-proteobacteria)]
MDDSTSILPLSVDGLTFEADGKRLLDGVSFTLPKGGVTAIIGPNGAGKSLTLRLCHGLLAATGGSVRWASAGPDLRAKRHAMVFQKPVMLRRSVRANIAHTLAAVGAADALAKVEAALARFGLTALAERPARLLSGGEQQRLALARAWALAPEVMLLDEPSSQLDPGATRQIEQLIAGLADEGMTILMSTHDLGQARRLSQRILFLHQGRLVEDRPTDAFFAASASQEARSFIAGDLLW